MGVGLGGGARVERRGRSARRGRGRTAARVARAATAGARHAARHTHTRTQRSRRGLGGAPRRCRHTQDVYASAVQRGASRAPCGSQGPGARRVRAPGPGDRHRRARAARAHAREHTRRRRPHTHTRGPRGRGGRCARRSPALAGGARDGAHSTHTFDSQLGRTATRWRADTLQGGWGGAPARPEAPGAGAARSGRPRGRRAGAAGPARRRLRAAARARSGRGVAGRRRAPEGGGGGALACGCGATCVVRGVQWYRARGGLFSRGEGMGVKRSKCRLRCAAQRCRQALGARGGAGQGRRRGGLGATRGGLFGRRGHQQTLSNADWMGRGE
jgi:hypothetical protein